MANANTIINTIEIKTCNTCTKDVRSPFRTYDSYGKVVTGCVDDSHTGQLIDVSESNRWHYRPVAIKMRQRTARNLKALLKQEKALSKSIAAHNRPAAVKLREDLWNARYPA